MLKKNKIIIFFIFMVIPMFINCKGNKEKMQFSFEQIQNFYYGKIEKLTSRNICPFYIDEVFFNKIEKQLNELIAESDYCSLMICINIDNGIFNVRALYNLKNEIYFELWEYNGVQKKFKMQNSSAKKILKSKPKDLVIIENTNLPVLDSTSTYIIKKIGKETYYYANYSKPDDVNYVSLIGLFREGYEQSCKELFISPSSHQ